MAASTATLRGVHVAPVLVAPGATFRNRVVRPYTAPYWRCGALRLYLEEKQWKLRR